MEGEGPIILSTQSPGLETNQREEGDTIVVILRGLGVREGEQTPNTK